MVVACTRLLRGSGYVAFDGEVPADPQHAALASEYAHVTAPLRRLGDRYAGEVCLALCAGEDVPGWVTERLHGLPATLQHSGQRSRRYERAVLDLVEAALLRGAGGGAVRRGGRRRRRRGPHARHRHRRGPGDRGAGAQAATGSCRSARRSWRR